MIRITEITNFKEWYETLALFEDVHIDFNQNGIKVQMKDVTNAFIISSFMELPVENTCSATISLDNLKTIKDSVTVYWSAETLVFQAGITKYKSPVLKDPKVDALVLPELPVPKFEGVKAVIPHDLIKEMLKVSEREEDILFKGEGKTLIVTNSSNSIENTYENVLESDEIPVKSVFGFNYINMVIKVMKYFDEVSIRVGKDVPIIINLNKPGFSISYWIAPRIED
ncbi:MAG TPA: hypothetical protein PK024_04565 [Methanospirillum sp.]|uniref:hypothetical protein n=1 Tax=Methanospirillum sp. TaxID=45200 RepID=UPI002CD19071|nr:hypothetical protein [Methanospirillum sp.]HOJ96097.1 hypothetical protein [Methanospirillum sp.]HPP76881.1 hypothetical protein [Methanospirillum sp.]